MNSAEPHTPSTPVAPEVVAAIAAALADGSMDDFVAQANEQASGEIIEGLVD